jgi:hypothetical protein
MQVAQRGARIRKRFEMIADVRDGVRGIRIDQSEDDALFRVRVMKTANIRRVPVRDGAVRADE